MKNGERLEFGLVGALVGGLIVGFASIAAFIPLRIDPMWWFVWSVFVCAPVGFIIGWRGAEKFKEWESRR